jgi:hypothetical protein
MIGGLGILAVAAFVAAYSGATVAFVSLGAGFAFGWLLMTTLIRTGVTRSRARSSQLPTVAVAVGVAAAAVITSALSAISPTAPAVFAPGAVAFVAGLILALRFSPLGNDRV